MTITAKVIKDSFAELCPRLTTLQLRYPRFIHAEFMTHRNFSRNSSSSRAIPVEKLIDDVMTDPAMPIHWGENQKGMQARGELTSAEYEWLVARDDAVRNAFTMHNMGYHKQLVNRIIEPFSHINVLVTGHEETYEQFFELRDHEDAQPEIRELARQMKFALCDSNPDFLEQGEWHIPYIDDDDPAWIERDETGKDFIDIRKVSAARCASVSYKTVDGNVMGVTRALRVFNKLAGSTPKHLSPFEHIATPCPHDIRGICKNFSCWEQYRSEVEYY